MVSEAARALHNAALVIDSHNDTIVNHMRAKLNLDGGPARQDGAAIVTRFGQGSGAELQLDFPKMRQAGINAAFFTVDVTNAKGTHLQYALDGLGFFLREAALSSSRGGKSAAVSIQDLDASVDGNLLSGTVTTGSVHIGENTSTALDEISCVVVNSGNHVSIQGSTISSVVIDA